jgi:hypothetical protein
MYHCHKPIEDGVLFLRNVGGLLTRLRDVINQHTVLLEVGVDSLKPSILECI